MHSYSHLFVSRLLALPPRAAGGHPTPPNLSGLYTVLFNKELEAQAGPVVYKQASRLVAQYYKAVQRCRENDLPGALTQLRTTDAELARLPAVAVDFATLFQLSAWGNYYYKAHEPALAVQTLLRGLSISADLERRGYQVFIYRRVEQLQNIATIYLQEGETDKANALIKNTLTFVHSGKAHGLFIDDWDETIFRSIRLIQEGTLDESLERLAKQNTRFLGHPTYGSHYYYHTFLRDLLREMTTETYNRTVLYNWMYVKAAYFEQGPEAFFQYALEFLTDPAVAPEYDELKANLLAEAARHIRQQAPHHAPQLVASLNAFSESNLADRSGKALKLAA